MDETTKQFLEDNFKAGEYVNVTILVKVHQFPALMQVLKTTNLTLAVLPSKAKMLTEEIDFLYKNDDKGNN